MTVRIHWAILRTASLLVPSEQRPMWLKEWLSELWYIPRQQRVVFCSGAFTDALWVRRNYSDRASPPYLDTPLSCLALMASLAAISVLVTAWLQTKLALPEVSGTPALSGFGVILVFYLLLATIALMIGDGPGRRRILPRQSNPRSWVLLALKVILTLPVLPCVLLIVVACDVPFLSLGAYTAYVLLLRWVFTDQQRRCPVCLHLLTQEVRIGSPSHTFLEWYGAESMCIRGHGVMQSQELSSTYSGARRWLRLDDSWGGLFPGAGPGNPHA